MSLKSYNQGKEKYKNGSNNKRNKANLNNMDVNTAVINFHKFLINSYEILKNIEGNEMFEEIQNDFYQTNWELLVESIVCTSGKEYLSEYGREQIVIHKAAGLVFPIKRQILKLYVKNQTKI